MSPSRGYFCSILFARRIILPVPSVRTWREERGGEGRGGGCGRIVLFLSSKQLRLSRVFEALGEERGDEGGSVWSECGRRILRTDNECRP